MAYYELWLADDSGNRIELLDDIISFEYAIIDGDSGSCTLHAPYSSIANISKTNPDWRIHVWYAPRGERMSLDAIYFLRDWQYNTDRAGRKTLLISGVDALDFLARRIVAYKAGSSEAEKTDNADDMMKEIVSENLGSGAAAARDVSSLSLVIEKDLSAGPNISKTFAYKNVLRTLKAIQSASKTAGTEVFFRLRHNGPKEFIFETSITQYGRDRTIDTGSNPVIFGDRWGNFRGATYAETTSREINYVYAGGQKTDDDRILQEVSDSPRINESLWNRREGFTNASNADSNALATAAGQAFLTKNRAEKSLSGEIVSTPQGVYGGLNGWKIGDRVTIFTYGRKFNARIRAVGNKIDASGQIATIGKIEDIS